MNRRSQVPLQVLYLNPFSEMGGAEHSLIALLQSLPPSVQATVVTEQPGNLSRLAGAAGAEVLHEAFPGLRSWAAGRRAGARIGSILRARGIDVVHGNSPRGAFYGGRAARAVGIPSIWHLRVHLRGGLRPWLLKRSNDHWIAASGSLLQDAGIDGNHSNAHVVPNGVPPHLIRNQPPDPWQHGNRGPTIGILGRLEPLKGQREFVEMACRLCQEGRPGNYVIGGDILGPAPGRPMEKARRYVSRLHARVAAAGLGDRIRFTGAVDDIAGFLDSLDMLIVPSHMEGFGRVVIEGMARGLVVVASHVGGIPEIIKSGDDGWLVPPGDPKALVHAVRFLGGSPEIAHRMATRAWSRARADFRAAGTTAGIVEVYEKITQRDLSIQPSETATRDIEVSKCTSLST